jgi:arabinan endo-1,5-alpha-L-arabinosidase
MRSINEFRRLCGWVVLVLLVTAGCGRQGDPELSSLAQGSTYRNPLDIRTNGDVTVESCADPTIIRAADPQDDAWYLYCTTDPLHGDDRDADGNLRFHLIPTFASRDLVSWEYLGDAFGERPSWVAPNAGLWAPEIAFFDGLYHLYYAASGTALPGGGSAIGVATSRSPAGPWTDSGKPVVEPHDAPCCPGARRWVFDPEVIETREGKFIYFGSYFGGISVRELSSDGLASDPASETQIAIPNRYEGAQVIEREGFYYLLASATDCCRGPLTGYSVFAGRSEDPRGPFVDRDGVSFLAGRVGGTPVISMNGNRWVGTGHHDVLTDFGGQDWMIYHAVDRGDPYFAGAAGFTKRPVLLDALDWVDGWPTVRGGRWASDGPELLPAAQPGEASLYRPRSPLPDRAGSGIWEDGFDGVELGDAWEWVREPAGDAYSVEEGSLRWPTQDADLHEDSDSASVLVRSAPEGDYLVETRVRLDVPPEGCCFNFVQAGLVIYGDDDNYLKMVHVSIWETRQTEFAKEEGPVPGGFPRYGNTVVSPPGEWTYLRIAREEHDGEELYTAHVSLDGEHWTGGGTWTHRLGDGVRIGLVSMGGRGFTAEFDYVEVSELSHGPPDAASVP